MHVSNFPANSVIYGAVIEIQIERLERLEVVEILDIAATLGRDEVHREVQLEVLQLGVLREVGEKMLSSLVCDLVEREVEGDPAVGVAVVDELDDSCITELVT